MIWNITNFNIHFQTKICRSYIAGILIIYFLAGSATSYLQACRINLFNQVGVS